MLHLIFLVLMIIVIVKANRGEFADTLCKVALVEGFLAGILGMVQSFFSQAANSGTLGFLNFVVFILAFALKPTAKHFVKLHDNAEEERREKLRRDLERHTRDGVKDPVYTEETFDDPELRFGKGGYTDYDPND